MGIIEYLPDLAERYFHINLKTWCEGKKNKNKSRYPLLSASTVYPI